MAPVKKPARERTRHYFREWRDHAKLTQEQAAAKIGWSQSKISRLEAGDTPFDQDDLELAASVYGCTTVELLMVDPRDPKNAWSALIKAAFAPEDLKAQIVSFIKFTLHLP